MCDVVKDGTFDCKKLFMISGAVRHCGYALFH